MSVKKAIVTIAIGDNYIDEFERYVRSGWQKYCNRHGYDLYVLTDLIDKNMDQDKKSLHWQKLIIGLIPDLKDYDYLVWMDTDIIINNNAAPCIVSQVTSDKIGIPIFDQTITPREHAGKRLDLFLTNLRNQITPKNMHHRGLQYDEHGREAPFLPEWDDPRKFINTGVFVFQPKLHNEFLSGVYLSNEEDCLDGSFEQTPFSRALMDKDLIEPIDDRFNKVWSLYAAAYFPFLFDYEFFINQRDVAVKCVNVFFQNNFFCHFAGAKDHPVTKGLMPDVLQKAEHILEVLYPDVWENRDMIFPDHHF
ncbi:MAG: hypothetical protein ISR52_04960 [Rhodospirillales bacterium]|nr:hypothetical protein [Rhodospirillales bacterium]